MAVAEEPSVPTQRICQLFLKKKKGSASWRRDNGWRPPPTDRDPRDASKIESLPSVRTQSDGAHPTSSPRPAKFQTKIFRAGPASYLYLHRLALKIPHRKPSTRVSSSNLRTASPDSPVPPPGCDIPAKLKHLIKCNRHHLNTSGVLA